MRDIDTYKTSNDVNNVCRESPIHGGEHEPADDCAQDAGRYFFRVCLHCACVFAQPIPHAPSFKIYEAGKLVGEIQ